MTKLRTLFIAYLLLIKQWTWGNTIITLVYHLVNMLNHLFERKNVHTRGNVYILGDGCAVYVFMVVHTSPYIVTRRCLYQGGACHHASLMILTCQYRTEAVVINDIHTIHTGWCRNLWESSKPPSCDGLMTMMMSLWTKAVMSRCIP